MSIRAILGEGSRDDFVCDLLRRFASEADFRRIFELCEKIKIMFGPFFASGPLSKIVVFRATRATFRFVRSFDGECSTLRSVFDRRIEPKTLAKPRFRRFSTSIDFETRADDVLDERAALSRLTRHPSTFDRYRGPFLGIGVFLENEASRSLGDFSTSTLSNLLSPSSIVSLQRPLRSFFRHLAFRRAYGSQPLSFRLRLGSCLRLLPFFRKVLKRAP